MKRSVRVPLQLAALWGVALLVVLAAVFDAFPPAAASKPSVRISPTSTATPSGTLDASAKARRSAARARASATASANPAASGDQLLSALNVATLGEDTAVASVAGLDVTTGEEVSWQSAAFGQALPAYTASIVKVDIAEAYLLQKADAGQTLDAAEQQTMQSMIVNSDNDSAQALYDDLGASALRTLNTRLGLTDTVLTDDGSWGLTQTSATDQLQLLDNLTSTQSPLSSSAQQYILGLMRSVESDQAWGAGTIGQSAAVKNGWLPLDDGDGWVINSLGVVTAPNGDQLELVVISNGWETEDEGIDACNDLVTNLVKALAA